MKFGLLHTARQHAEICDLPSLEAAEQLLYLVPGATDHGVIPGGIGVVMAEFGLFDPPEQQAYFAFVGWLYLYAGPAVLYGFDVRGNTVDLVRLPGITWLPDRRAVEHAIAEGIVKRPHFGIDDDVIWRWPGPRPSEAEFAALSRRHPVSDATIVVVGDDVIIMPPERKR